MSCLTQLREASYVIRKDMSWSFARFLSNERIIGVWNDLAICRADARCIKYGTYCATCRAGKCYCTNCCVELQSIFPEIFEGPR